MGHPEKCLFIDVFNRTSYVYLFFNGKSYENPMKCYVSMGNPMKILCFNGKSYENPMKIRFSNGNLGP